MIRSHIFDTSEELLVQRWGSGVKFTRPEDFNQSSANEVTPPSVRHLFEMSVNFYFLNTQHVIQNMNEKTAHICGFQERKDAIGTTARDVLDKESAEFSIQHNNEVISHNSIIIKDEHFSRLDESEFRVVAIKYPLYNSKGKLIGVLGCSVDSDSFAQSLNLLMNSGLLSSSGTIINSQDYCPADINSDIQQYNLNDLSVKLAEKYNVSTSKRELQCLYYLMKGKSARESGLILNLSQRTVEYYLNCLKEKMHCTRKSELIEAVYNLL